MALDGVLGNGSKIGYSASSPVSWTRVVQVMNIDTFLQLVPEDVDTTVYGTSNIKTNMPGLIDPPELVFTCLADNDPATAPSHEALRQYQSGSNHANAGAIIYWRVEVPVDRAQGFFRAWEFRGFVKSVMPSVPIGDKQTTQYTVRFAGDYWVTTAKVATAIS